MRSTMMASATTAQSAMGYMPPLPARKRWANSSKEKPEPAPSAANNVNLVSNPEVIPTPPHAVNPCHRGAMLPCRRFGPQKTGLAQVRETPRYGWDRNLLRRPFKDG